MSIFRVSKKNKLNARDEELYSLITHLSHQVRVSKKKNEDLRKRLQRAESATEKGYDKILNQMIAPVRNFILCHFRNANANKFHRKFTIEDKVFALSLHKRSAMAYRYMSKIFCLPSVETIRKLAQSLDVRPGLCDTIFENLKLQGEKRAADDKYCVLMMDEVEIDVTILLNESTGTVEGFSDDGTERKCEIADHASVWMLKGLPKNANEKPWKQAIAFSFCKTSIKVADLIRTYKEIVRRVSLAGFKVVASICDQGKCNESAIKTLIADTRAAHLREGKPHVNDTIVIDDNEIVHIFDPPHLLKCLRNNLITKNLKFFYENKEREASWEDIVLGYNIDKSHGVFRVLKKLSDNHVIPEKI